MYNDQVTTVPLAIGQEAVDKLTDKIGVGELYKEVDVNSTIEDTSNENDVTLNSLMWTKAYSMMTPSGNLICRILQTTGISMQTETLPTVEKDPGCP